MEVNLSPSLEPGLATGCLGENSTAEVTLGDLGLGLEKAVWLLPVFLGTLALEPSAPWENLATLRPYQDVTDHFLVPRAILGEASTLFVGGQGLHASQDDQPQSWLCLLQLRSPDLRGPCPPSDNKSS